MAAVESKYVPEWMEHNQRGDVGPNPEQRQKLYEAAELGYSLSACAANADLSAGALDHWLKKGRPAVRKLLELEDPRLTPSEKVYAAFANEFDRARARGVKHLEDVSTARANEGMGTWSEAVTKLERGHRDEWGRGPQVVQGGGPTVIVIEGRPARTAVEEIEGRLVERAEDQRALRPAPGSAGISE
jgi:hypothetical protein